MRKHTKENESNAKNKHIQSNAMKCKAGQCKAMQSNAKQCNAKGLRLHNRNTCP